MKTIPVHVRNATAADLPFVQSLSREAFGRFGAYDDFLEDLIRGGALTRTADREGRPVGFSMVLRLDDVPQAFDLVAIAVDETARRRGIGRVLLHDAHRMVLAAAGADRVHVRLHVAEVNVPARRLFESAGYRLAGRDDDFYPNGQRALSMERWLLRGEPVE